MTSDQTYHEAFDFPAPAETVFDVIWAQPTQSKMPKLGDILETATISGKPGVVGFQQQVRMHHGGLDLVMIEVLTAFERPHKVVVQQTPDCLQRHDPNERDVPFLETTLGDLDAEFLYQFGDPPFQTEVTMDLTPQGQDTRLTVTVKSIDMPKLGWFKRRAWRTQVKQKVAGIADRISAGL